MKTALILGGGASLHDDLERLSVDYDADAVVACNDAGAVFPGPLAAWITLHPRKLFNWQRQREANGHPACNLFFSHTKDAKVPELRVTPYLMNAMRGSASSGLYATKVALVDLSFDRAILCGIPLLSTPHYFDKKAWTGAEHFRKELSKLDTSFVNRIRSMSGWTRLFFGPPDDWKQK